MKYFLPRFSMNIAASLKAASRRMQIVIALIPMVLFVPGTINAQQKQTEHREMTWFGLFNQTRLTQRSGVWVDLHWRLNDKFVNETHALIGRAAYMFYLSDRTRLSAGYAWQLQPAHHGNPAVREHRPWQQIQWFEKKKGFNMMQWVRLEQRFRHVGNGGDYDFLSHRVRYNISFSIPLNSKELNAGSVFAFTNNEVFINAGKNIVNNYFDQNRFFAGFGYQITSHSNAQLGYMNVFQQLPSGNRYVSSDVIRLFYFHNVDFRNQE